MPVIETTQPVADLLNAELLHAKTKHPWFPRNTHLGHCIIDEEIGEIAKDINDGAPMKQLLREVAQGAVTCIRFLEQHEDELTEDSLAVGHSFIDDADKLRDFFALSKDEFLASYSYLTEEDYEITREQIIDKATMEG